MYFVDAISNKYYFEDVANFKINPADYFDVVRSELPEDWDVCRSGLYFNCDAQEKKNLPFQGWKIHISSNILNAVDILRIVSKKAIEHGFAFKFVADRELHSVSTQKAFPRSQSGKFITIYPENTAKFIRIIEDLYLSLKKFEGSYILSDRRYKDCKVLYYRYGGFKSIKRLKVDGSIELCIQDNKGGLIPDSRKPFFELPSFISDPFPQEKVGVSNDRTANRLFDTYANISPIKQSNSGGVYNAISRISGQNVIIKEARPCTLISFKDQIDAVDYRKNEEYFYKLFQENDYTVKYIDSFYAWEHYYLVVEKINGMTLREFINRNNPFFYNKVDNEKKHNYMQSIYRILCNLIDVITSIHEKGVIISDLSQDNIMLTDDLEVKLIDLEAAFYNQNPPKSTLSTISNTNIDFGKYNYKHIDYYSLGIIFYDCLLQRGTLSNLDNENLILSLKEFLHDYDLSFQILTIVEKLISINMNSKIENLNMIKECINDLPLKQTAIQRDDKHIDGSYGSIIDMQIDIMLKFMRNPGTSLKPFTPIIGNNLNLSYGYMGIRYFLNQKMKDAIECEYFDEWILNRVMQNKEVPPGLFSGLSGIALGLLLSGKESESQKVLKLCKNHKLLPKSHTYFDGLTGYGMVLLKFWEITGNENYLKESKNVADLLLTKHSKDINGDIFWGNEDSNIEIGLFYGSTGVALFFLNLYCATDEVKYLKLGEKMLSFDLNKKSKDSVKGYIGFPKNDSKNSTILPYFGQGTAGILAVLLRYYVVTGNGKYKDVLEELVPLIEIKYAVFPGLYNGLAGLANTLLDLFDFLGEERFKIQAKNVIDGIMLFKLNINGHIFFPGDHLLKISLDLGSGSAGICEVLDRYENSKNNILFFNDTILKKKRIINNEKIHS
ncbi:hypothetical protein BK704_01410 [[Bacillus thuringiensis] serovar konkukian]|nr:class III lanthionine synthetase LanKC [Bacillus thuringiensis]MED1304304.1 class III lanthionine synthetase LanKC [Bacillus pacificus]OUA94838.1 hypothetical protein BK704_28985 [[Bacillus thuringiensis] serovar konkukian]OUB17490.1 hypothetical protein BK704_01490 [[Bacillus thuringiensis] serovar konkukian]OUB17557.1 hypothetical protein BK704_01410 [[Bacillus thuringiensis] serovar konkukian]